MPSRQPAARPYQGPVLVASPTEAARIFTALYGADDPQAEQLRAKCVAVLDADPKWRKPLS